MATPTRKRRRWLWWVIGIVGVVVAALIAGPFIYIHFIEADPPPRLAISTAPPTTTKSASSAVRAPLAGTWNVGSGSTVGYRLNEVLFGQNDTAAGRTTSVTGKMTITGTTAEKADFSVDMTTVTSDRSQRDRQFQGRIMETSQFPTATFKLTKPIALGKEPADGEKISVPATGDLMLHGVTNSVTTTLQARRTGNTIEVSGSIPVVFADYQISNPSFGGITTEDHGILEFLLDFQPA
jgi:polyisoprenoid-binding protein YceI